VVGIDVVAIDGGVRSVVKVLRGLRRASARSFYFLVLQRA
jgi:hypothetical protein